MFRKDDARWKEMFHLFKRYVSEKCSFPMMATVYENENLGYWYTNQVSAFKRNLLPADRLGLLNSVSPVWNASLSEKRAEEKRFLLSSNWKKNLLPGDAAIDLVFQGDALYSCLKQGIYSCRDYINAFHQQFSRSFVSVSGCADPLFRLDNRRKVFDIQFPNLDFGCFHLWLAVFSPKSDAGFFETWHHLNEINHFGSKEGMFQHFNDVLEAFLNPQEAYVIANRFFEFKTLSKISDEHGRTVERIREIERKALRKMRLPRCCKYIDLNDPERALSYMDAIKNIQQNNGNLDISDTKIVILPPRLNVPGSLFLNVYFELIPESITVGGNIFCVREPIKVPDHLKHKIFLPREAAKKGSLDTQIKSAASRTIGSVSPIITPAKAAAFTKD